MLLYCLEEEEEEEEEREMMTGPAGGYPPCTCMYMQRFPSRTGIPAKFPSVP